MSSGHEPVHRGRLMTIVVCTNRIGRAVDVNGNMLGRRADAKRDSLRQHQSGTGPPDQTNFAVAKALIVASLEIVIGPRAIDTLEMVQGSVVRAIHRVWSPRHLRADATRAQASGHPGTGAAIANSQ